MVPLTVNGWTIYAHPLFLRQVEALEKDVTRIKRKNPAGWMASHAAKRLAAIHHLAFEVIPENPARPEFRLGGALGEAHRHWFRAKFFQQYRLFFRFHAPSRIIVLAWVNDEETMRAYESSDDAYRTFARMLKRGRPPDGWDGLLKEAQRG